MGYYEIGRDKEISFGHEYNFQHGYMPFDAGLNFIDYTVGSIWGKFSSDSFWKLHWMKSTGTKYWNSDIVYNTMLRNSLDIESAIVNNKIDDYVQTDVLGGDFNTILIIKKLNLFLGLIFLYIDPIRIETF